MSIDRRAVCLAVATLFTATVAWSQGQPAPATSGTTTTTTTTTVKSGVVVYVSGNTLVTKESDGVTRQHTVPDGFTFQMRGKNVTLADLKPGDKITAVITETTTSQPVTVTRVVKGKVITVTPGSIVVQNAKGQWVTYTTKDVQGRDVTIIQNGQEVAMGSLKPGDVLTATIVTKFPPQVSTETQVNAKVTAPPPPPAAATPAPAPAPVAKAPAPKPAKMPKTASPLPLFGLVGGLLVLAGAGLTLRRRSRLAR
jgi:hypothetical protein